MSTANQSPQTDVVLALAWGSRVRHAVPISSKTIVSKNTDISKPPT